MSAGGPSNPTTFNSAEVYLPPSQAGPVAHEATVKTHPYGYFPAVCGTCGTTLNFATQDEAETWSALHAEATQP